MIRKFQIEADEDLGNRFSVKVLVWGHDRVDRHHFSQALRHAFSKFLVKICVSQTTEFLKCSRISAFVNFPFVESFAVFFAIPIY
jgi:hypothetical protein